MTDGKSENENDRSYVKTLWQKCVPHELCRYIYLKDNYLILTQLQITFQKVPHRKCKDLSASLRYTVSEILFVQQQFWC